MSEQTQITPEQALSDLADYTSSPEVILAATPFQVIAELATEQSKQDYLAHIEEQLQEDPILSHINRAFDTIDTKHSEIKDSWEDGMPHQAQRAENARKELFIKRLRERLVQVYGDDAVSECSSLRLDKSQIKSYDNFYVSGKAGDSIFTDVISRAVNQDVDARSIFVPEEPLLRAKGPLVSIETSPNAITEIPIGMFVSAVGFDSWNGRSRRRSDGTSPSQEKIEDYASRETSPPPIDTLSGLALPDGRLVFVSGNSHRLAAQLRDPNRQTIPFSGSVSIKALETIPYSLRTNEQHQTAS